MKLSTAFPFVIFGGLFLAIYRYLESIGSKGVWFYITGYLATAFLIIAASVAIGWGIDNFPRISNAVGSLIERAFHPDVAMAYYVSTMDGAKLAYLAAMQHEVIVEPSKLIWRANGIEMPEEWILSHLGRCNRHFPQLPAVNKQANGSTQQLREMAFIEFGVMESWIAKREGMTAIWVNDWTPEKVKERLV